MALIMLYKNFLQILLLLFLTNCTVDSLNNSKVKHKFDKEFSNKGFTLIYNEKLFKNKIISKKLDERDLIIFQKNLKRNTKVKITNIINNKSLIAKVGKNSTYPLFNNSVISERIAKELNLDMKEPYVEILSIPDGSMFIAKQAKTFDEEKQVANKVPIKSISITDLNIVESNNKKVMNEKFSYKIKIADFYFKKTALLMINRIKLETKVKDPKLKKIFKNKYRVYLGPFGDIISLQNSFNDINILGFENIEFIKND